MTCNKLILFSHVILYSNPLSNAYIYYRRPNNGSCAFAGIFNLDLAGRRFEGGIMAEDQVQNLTFTSGSTIYPSSITSDSAPQSDSYPAATISSSTASILLPQPPRRHRPIPAHAPNLAFCFYSINLHNKRPTLPANDLLERRFPHSTSVCICFVISMNYPGHFQPVSTREWIDSLEQDDAT
jgi:hypothetical protein